MPFELWARLAVCPYPCFFFPKKFGVFPSFFCWEKEGKEISPAARRAAANRRAGHFSGQVRA